jgi:hypothetical protein
VLFYTILFLLRSQPVVLSPMTPHSVDDIAGAFGSSVVELSFLHPEHKSPIAIRQINSNLTCFIVLSFHKLRFPIYTDLFQRFILRERQLAKPIPRLPKIIAETHSQNPITTTEIIIANIRIDCRFIMALRIKVNISQIHDKKNRYMVVFL